MRTLFAVVRSRTVEFLVTFCFIYYTHVPIFLFLAWCFEYKASMTTLCATEDIAWSAPPAVPTARLPTSEVCTHCFPFVCWLC